MTTGLESVATPVGWALLHLSWQGFVVALLFALAGRVASCGIRERYRLGLGTLLLAVALTTANAVRATLAPALQPPSESSASDGFISGELGTVSVSTDSRGPADRRLVQSEALILVTGAWAFVAFASLGWIGGGILLLRRRVARGLPLPPRFQVALDEVLMRLPALPHIRALQSSEISTPMLLGMRRPAILLPSRLLQRISVDDFEAIVAHELAHLHRRDLLASFLQSVAEALLLRHPAITWMSRQVRIDRELCCDDLATRWLGDRTALARALAEAEFSRSVVLVPAVWATEGELTARIRRLLSPAATPAHPRRSAWSIAWIAIIGVLAVPLLLGAPPRPSAASTRLALGGIDPVRLLEGRRETGSSSFELERGDFRYRFVSADSRAAFEADPARFSITNAEACPITGEPVDADVYRVVDERIYLFCCDTSTTLDAGWLRAWLSKPAEERQPLAQRYSILSAALGSSPLAQVAGR